MDRGIEGAGRQERRARPAQLPTRRGPDEAEREREKKREGLPGQDWRDDEKGITRTKDRCGLNDTQSPFTLLLHLLLMTMMIPNNNNSDRSEGGWLVDAGPVETATRGGGCEAPRRAPSGGLGAAWQQLPAPWPRDRRRLPQHGSWRHVRRTPTGGGLGREDGVRRTAFYYVLGSHRRAVMPCWECVLLITMSGIGVRDDGLSLYVVIGYS
ncbi:hypothetical protein VTO42DRAFT_5892 [Malbranchea cinnamomea]